MLTRRVSSHSGKSEQNKENLVIQVERHSQVKRFASQIEISSSEKSIREIENKTINENSVLERINLEKKCCDSSRFTSDDKHIQLKCKFPLDLRDQPDIVITNVFQTLSATD